MNLETNETIPLNSKHEITIILIEFFIVIVVHCVHLQEFHFPLIIPDFDKVTVNYIGCNCAFSIIFPTLLIYYLSNQEKMLQKCNSIQIVTKSLRGYLSL